MTEEEIVEVMARAMATTEKAVTPWWTFKPEARAILAALSAKGLCVVKFNKKDPVPFEIEPDLCEGCPPVGYPRA